jgi:hypothetical protein
VSGAVTEFKTHRANFDVVYWDIDKQGYVEADAAAGRVPIRVG